MNASSPASPSSARPIVVQKYGGSSVADVAKIGRVADRVVATRRAGHDVVVVVSAMGKSTDGLLALAQEASALPDGRRTEPARRELDMLLSTGERVAMTLLSIAIQARGEPAISFTGSQSGILTNDRHFDARIIEVRPHRIEDELARGNIVIVAGYQGMSYRREITTLGRGGSDTTAVALAAALSASCCEIYSDVDGVYSADPRVVPSAAHLPEIDAEMLQELAEGGAKVLCAQAVEWARRKGIVLHAKATAGSPRETVVRAGHTESTIVARAVTSEAKILLVTSEAPIAVAQRALADASLAYKDLTSDAHGSRFVVPLLNQPTWEGALATLRAALPDVVVHEGVASVSVVGDGLAATPEPLGRFLAALGEAGATPLAVWAGPLRLSAVIAGERVESAQRALHAAFVEARAGGRSP